MPANTAQSLNKRGTAVSVVLFLIAMVSGDASMLAVVGSAKWLYHGSALVHFLITIPVIALGGYLIFGLPQIAAWSSGSGHNLDRFDIRSQTAGRLINRGGVATFIVASAIGGPMAIGWYYGRKQHPKARVLTFASAWILAVVWTAVYLGLLTWIFD